MHNKTAEKSEHFCLKFIKVLLFLDLTPGTRLMKQLPLITYKTNQQTINFH